MINGMHAIIYSAKPGADRDFFQDILKLTHVDVGEGWLIFGLPPAEIAVHPAEKSGAQEIYLMCENIRSFVKEMSGQNIKHSPVSDQGYGLFTKITLPGGGKLGVYQPRHARPEPMKIKSASKKPKGKLK